ALPSTVSLALESAALTEDIHRRKNERRFRALIEQSSDTVIVLDGDAHVAFVSPACHNLLGLSDEDAIGHSPFEFVHADDTPSVQAIFDKVEAGQTVLDPVEIRLRHV